MRSILYCGILSHNQTQLKECSLDTERNEYMTDVTIPAINFDKVKTEYLNDVSLSEEMCKSVDAIVSGNNLSGPSIYLIEFKNGHCKDEVNNINYKVRDSLLLLCDIMETNIKETRERFEFVLVYNQDNTGFKREDLKAIAMAQKAGIPCPVLKLNKIEGVYLKRAVIIEKNDFKKWLQRRGVLD